VEPVRVDVVVATNRASPYLPETLESLRSQTYPHWQLIIVDDGSPDPDGVARMAASTPRTTIVRQANRGLPASRNVGIAHGTAPLIALLDDDDLWEPDKLAAQVEALAAAPTSLASFTGGRYIDGEGRSLGETWSGKTTPSPNFLTGEVPPPRIVTLMVRRTANTLVGGFDESYSIAEDNDYILRLTLAGELVGVDRPLTRYRRHETNMSVSGSPVGRTANLRVLDEQLRRHRDDKEITRLLSQRRHRVHAAAAEECSRALARTFRERDAGDVLAELRWAARTAPWETLKQVGGKFARHEG
jgi:glycosyltransferase involved in cell wall biosynthesis